MKGGKASTRRRRTYSNNMSKTEHDIAVTKHSVKFEYTPPSQVIVNLLARRATRDAAPRSVSLRGELGDVHGHLLDRDGVELLDVLQPLELVRLSFSLYTLQAIINLRAHCTQVIAL